MAGIVVLEVIYLLGGELRWNIFVCMQISHRHGHGPSSSQELRPSVSQSVGQSVSHAVSQTVLQSASQPASQPRIGVGQVKRERIHIAIFSDLGLVPRYALTIFVIAHVRGST